MAQRPLTCCDAFPCSTMNLSHKFIQIIRSGRLNALRRLFDAGLQLDLHDLQGDAALAMGMACHMGHKEIVRELFTRGVPLNLPDNRHPTSPLSMAIRGKQPETVRLLLELGAELPDDLPCGLSANEIMIARWKAQRDGHARIIELAPFTLPDIEEIDLAGCAGIDTSVLENDVMHLSRNMR